MASHEPEPGAVQVGRLLVAHRQHPAAVVEAVVGRRGVLEVAGDAVRLAQGGRGAHDARELGERPQEVALLLVGQQLRGEPGSRPSSRRCGGSKRPGMGVLHVEDRVVVGGLRPEVEVDVEVGLERVAHECVAGCVDADRLDQVEQRDDVAGALAHPHDRAVAEQVDHLADDDLEVDAGLVAEGGAQRHHPADVAVVVGAEQDDAALEAPLPLVEVVRRVAGDVGAVTVALDDHAVLVVAVLLGAQPDGTVRLVDVAELAEPRERAVGGAGLVEVVLVEVHVERHPEVAQRLLDLVEHQPDAVRAERLEGLVVGQPRSLRMGGDDLLGDLGDVLPGVAVLGRRLVPRPPPAATG